VFRPAILHAASALILAHNHPSGDPNPSEEDLAIHAAAPRGRNLLGIELLDHIVLAEGGYTSMRSGGSSASPPPRHGSPCRFF